MELIPCYLFGFMMGISHPLVSVIWLILDVIYIVKKGKS